MRRRLYAHLLTMLILGTFAALMFWLRRDPVRDLARRSAEEVLVLNHALHSAPYFFYPDAMIEADINYRIEKWESLRRGRMLLEYAEREVRGKKTQKQVMDDFRRELERRRMASDTLEKEWMEQTRIPIDPFGGRGERRYYRYGVSPRKAAQSTLRPNSIFYNKYKPAPWIIAGNGPDGDADVDVMKFDAEVSSATGAIDPLLGFGREPLDLIYDPTNGSVSDGDIIFIHDKTVQGPGPGPRALWDEAAFRKRYGL